MVRRRKLERASGILTGFSRRWNPFSTKVNIRINVGKKTIKVPIDYRQRKFIEVEYAIGSRVEIERFEGNWHIKSQLEPMGESYLGGETTFLPPGRRKR